MFMPAFDAVSDTPEPDFQLPYKIGAKLLKLVSSVIALVRADASNVPRFHREPSILTVPALPVLSNTAVSCANGNSLMLGVPPELGAQAVADQFCVPARFQ